MNDLIKRLRNWNTVTGDTAQMCLKAANALVLKDAEIKRLHELHLKRTKLTHKALLDVAERNERIEQLEIGVADQRSAGEEHALECVVWDKMDSGKLFVRHDWPCTCGYRKDSSL